MARRASADLTVTPAEILEVMDANGTNAKSPMPLKKIALATGVTPEAAWKVLHDMEERGEADLTGPYLSSAWWPVKPGSQAPAESAPRAPKPTAAKVVEAQNAAAKPKRKRATKAEMAERREKEAQRIAYAVMRDEELDRQTYGGKPYSKEEEEASIASHLPTARELLALPDTGIVILTPSGPVAGTEETIREALEAVSKAPEVSYDDLAEESEPESQTGLTRAQIAEGIKSVKVEKPSAPVSVPKPFTVEEHESDLEKRGEILDIPEFIPAKPDGPSDNAWYMAHAAATQSARDWWMEYCKRQVMADALS